MSLNESFQDGVFISMEIKGTYDLHGEMGEKNLLTESNLKRKNIEKRHKPDFIFENNKIIVNVISMLTQTFHN